MFAIVRAVLPLCWDIFLLWSRNPKATEEASVGAFSENLRLAPTGEIFSPFRRGKHRTRLVAGRRNNRAEARTHLQLRRKL